MLDARALIRSDDFSDERKLAKFLADSNRDVRKFLRNYAKITDFEGNVINLDFNVSQAKLYAVIETIWVNGKPVRVIVLKSRQCGISTASSGLIFGRTFTKPNTNSMVIGHHKDATTNLFNKFRYFYDNLPQVLKDNVPLMRSNKQELYCKILNWRISMATAGTIAGTRSNTIQNLLYTEAAFYDDFFGLKKSTEAAVPRLPGTIIIIETTANGSDNDYHKLWKMAEAGESAYIPLFLKWFEDPQYSVPAFPNAAAQDEVLTPLFDKYPDLLERQKDFNLTAEQIAWYGIMLSQYYEGDEQIMMQEFPCTPQEAFLSTGKPVVPQKFTLQMLRRAKEGKRYDPTIPWTRLDQLKEDASLRPNRDTYLEIHKPPQSGRFYLISADPAQGLENSDFSCAHIFDIASRCVVATLHGRIELEPFADMIAKLAYCYNMALVMPEVDGLGAGLLSYLKRKYHRIYQQRKKVGFTEQLTQKLGWETSVDTRKEIVAAMRLMISERWEDPELIPDKWILDELLTFVNRDGKPQAQKGAYDDRVMALAVGWRGCIEEIVMRPEILKSLSTDTIANSKIKPRLTIEDTVRLIKHPDYYGQSLHDLAANEMRGPLFTEERELW